MTDPFSRTPSEKERREEEQRAKEFLLEAAMTEEHVRLYNRAEALAKFRYWVRRPWRRDEAVALSFGKDPAIVNSKSIIRYAPVWPFAREYWERTQLLRRHFEESELWFIDAEGLISWAFEMGIDLPAELKTEAENYRRDRLGAEADAVELNKEAATLRTRLAETQQRLEDLQHQVAILGKELKMERLENPKARTTQDKLNYALALKYRFSLDKRNSAAANIHSALLNHSVKLDVGVIHDRLSEAVERFGAGDLTDESEIRLA